MLNSIRFRRWGGSPTLRSWPGSRTDLNGLTDDDPEAAQWIIRIVLSLMYWPIDDADAERRIVQRFVSPAFGS